MAESDSSGPINKAEIAQAWSALSNDVVSMFGEIPESDFAVERSGWSYAQNLDHLIKSAGAVAQALSLPKLLIRILFGKSTCSRSSGELQSAYHAILDRGGQARGKFVPTGSESRDQLLRKWQRISSRLLRNLQSWNEQQLDELRLPHPLLGKLTVREMLYFTQFHTRHHLDRCSAKKT